MTRHTIKVKPYAGEGRGVDITSRLIIDKLTLSILDGTAVCDRVVDEVVQDLREAVYKAARENRKALEKAAKGEA